MIKLLDKNNNVITLFTNLNNYYIQSTLEDAEKLIHFRVARSTPYSEELIEENYLETKDYRFIIKEVNFNSKDYIQVFGKLDVDDLRATLIRDYESVEKPLSITLDELLMGTGWTHDIIAPHKLRTVRIDPEEDAPRTIKETILRAMNTYDYEVEFDSLNKVVRVREKLGADRGAYLQTELNIKRLERQSDTYDFRTRLYAYGKDGLTFEDINDGKDYVENFSFSNKILETIWKDDRYTVKENLLEAAHKKLAEIAKPRTSFAIEILQLTNLNPIYSILDYRLGDSVKLIDSTNEIIETHRIVKLIEYPLTPEKNKVELSNTQLRFKTTQAEQIKEIAAQEATKTETSLMREIERVNQIINSPEKGFVIVRKDENGNIYEQLIMDTDNVATAQNVWRWNIHGLAHSSTGYNGDYELALTKDGSINANMITTGLLNGEFIEAGTLQASHIVFGGATLDLKLGEMETQTQEAENAAKDYTDTQLGTFATAVSGTLDELQDQIDGSITTWFYDIPPTTSNAPANLWTTTELKNIHLGDLYYDTLTGYAYRWQVVAGVYSWQRITDSDVTKALEDASKAQDTADSKRRVFTTTPTTPYEVGDLWAQGATGELMRCKTTALNGAYVASHWEKASKYTDDQRAIQAEAAAKAHAEAKADEAKTAAETYAATKAEAERVLAEAYADGIVDDEEQARIDAVNAAVTAAATDASNKASAAEAAAKTYAEAQAAAALNSAKADATAKADAAQEAAITAANAKAEAERVLAEAYADGIVDDEEAARIAEAEANLAAAKADATAKADAAEQAAKTYAATQAANAKAEAETAANSYADAQLALEKTRADAYADGVLDEAEAHAIAQAEAKRDEAKLYAEQKAAAAEDAARAYADNEIELLEADLSDLLRDVIRGEDLGVINDSLNDYINVLNSEIERISGLEDSVANNIENISVLLDLQDTIMKWDFVDNYMVASEDGLEIGQKGSTTRILITPDSIDFFDGSSVPVASITGQMLTINRGLFVKSAQIGEHQIETITGGHTTFTWMGV